MRVKIVGAGLCSIVLAVAVGCSSGESSLDLSESGTAVVVAKGGNSPHFDPDVIKVPRGKEVTLTFKNDDKVPHTFIVSYLGVDAKADPGQSVPVKFTAPNSGKLSFRDRDYQGVGMYGTIEVT